MKNIRRNSMKKTQAKMLGLGLAVALSLTACAPSGSDNNGGSSKAVDTAEYQAVAEKAMAPITEWPGPVSGPVAKKGAKVMWLSGGLAAEGFAAPAAAAEEAATVLGWELNVVDGQFDPKVYNRSIEEAIDQGYDAIVMNGITVQAVAESVKKARAAGIVIGSWDGGNQPAEDGVNYEVTYPVAEQGVALASYLIWKTDGMANAYLTESPEFNVIMEWVGAARDTFESCSSCTVAGTGQFTAGEVATKVPSMITSALRADPSINVVIGGYDAAMLAAVPEIRAAGFKEVQIGSFNAIQPMTQFIRDGDVSASVAEPYAWGAWATLDNLNRILSNEETVEQGIPFRLITSNNVNDIEPDTNWTGDIDFKSYYTAIWTGK